MRSLREITIEHCRILSSIARQLDWVLLCYPYYDTGGGRGVCYKEIYTNLFKALPAETKFTILYYQNDPDIKRDLDDILARAGRGSCSTSTKTDCVPIDNQTITPWVQDPFVIICAKRDGRNVRFFVKPHTFKRSEDEGISDFIPASRYASLNYPLYFEGGNILADESFVIVGVDSRDDTVELNASHAFIDIPRGVLDSVYIESLYSEKFVDGDQKALIMIETKGITPSLSNLLKQRSFIMNGVAWTESLVGLGVNQPLFHLDMFITLAGRSDAHSPYRVLIGEPRFLDQHVPDEYKTLSKYLDKVADFFPSPAFEVHRNPLPLTYVDYVDNESHPSRMWYFATTNNCLVQIGEQRRVWLPTYGHGDWQYLEATDRENQEIWKKLGFDVCLLDADYNWLVQEGGAVHCITKVLESLREYRIADPAMAY